MHDGNLCEFRSQSSEYLHAHFVGKLTLHSDFLERLRQKRRIGRSPYEISGADRIPAIEQNLTELPHNRRWTAGRTGDAADGFQDHWQYGCIVFTARDLDDRVTA